MDSYIATKKGKKVVVSLDDRAIIERHTNRINALNRFDARRKELKKLGYHIQHVGVETIQGRRIEQSEPIQRQRKVRMLGQWVNE